PEFTFSGHHHMQGILIANGPMFLKGEVEARQSLLDIAPTLLYLAGLPVPSYMEGNVLEAWFDPTYLERNPVTFSGEKARETGGPNELIPVIPYVQ
ncbi:MAG: hypothetical protein HKN21_13955, partial [Candidatus Eisenbacteria bacterium]|nr:hypothetical protein [Candidatus Eisenbacteria bacterium]